MSLQRCINFCPTLVALIVHLSDAYILFTAVILALLFLATNIETVAPSGRKRTALFSAVLVHVPWTLRRARTGQDVRALVTREKMWVQAVGKIWRRVTDILDFECSTLLVSAVAIRNSKGTIRDGKGQIYEYPRNVLALSALAATVFALCSLSQVVAFCMLP